MRSKRPASGWATSKRGGVVLELERPARCSWERREPVVCDTKWLLRRPPPWSWATPRVARPVPSWAPRRLSWLGRRSCRRRWLTRPPEVPTQDVNNCGQQSRRTCPESRQSRRRKSAEERIDCSPCRPGALLCLQSRPCLAYDCNTRPHAPRGSPKHEEPEEETDKIARESYPGPACPRRPLGSL